MIFENVIADHYGPQTARDYDRLAAELFWSYSESLSAAAAEVVYGRRGENCDLPRTINTILDLGMGTGNLSVQILNEIEAAQNFKTAPESSVGSENISLVGLDLSSAMLEQAQKKLTEYRAVRTEFCEGRLEKGPEIFADRKFDCIVSSYAVHHMDGKQKHKLIMGLYELLNPGGILVIADKMTDDDANINRDFHAVICSRFSKLFADRSRPPVLYSELLQEIKKQFDNDGDKPSTLNEHLEWFKAAGLSRVRAPFTSFGTAVVSGVKSG